MTLSLDTFTPPEVVELITRAGVTKGNMPLEKIFLSSVSGGCLLAFACGSLLSTATAPWFQEHAPGLIRTISSMVFPYGLCMIILTGVDLCTSSFLVRFTCVPTTEYHLTETVHHGRSAAAPSSLVEDAHALVHRLLGQPRRLTLRGRHHLRLYALPQASRHSSP